MTAQKYLVVQLGRIGDLILMTPMFRTIKAAGEGNEVHLLASLRNQQVAEKLPDVDRVHVYRKRLVHTAKLLRAINAERYDVWIDPKDHYSRESRCFARFSNAALKIGFNRGEKGVFDFPVSSDVEQASLHAVERNLRALEPLHLEPATRRPVLPVDAASRERLSTFLERRGIGSYVCVNISAGTEERRWPIENWVGFLSGKNDPALRFVVIAGPGDEGEAQTIMNLVPGAFHYETPAIGDVYPVIERSLLTVTPDTAAVHIAAAFDVPVLGLYFDHEANYSKFRPLSTVHRVVRPPGSGRSVADIPLDLLVKSFDRLMEDIDGGGEATAGGGEGRSGG
jgi:ADP-heptose:LPS heptosyltransferase